MHLIKHIEDGLPDGYCIQVVGLFKRDLKGQQVVHLETRIFKEEKFVSIDDSFVYKPFKIFRKTWKEKCEIRIQKMIESARKKIDERIFFENINNGLLDSLDQLN